MKPGGDGELIERCLGGQHSAWTELIARYQRLVYSVAHGLCPADDVSDVFQQVWLECYERLGELRNVDALPAWLMTITRRRAYAVRRAHGQFAAIEEEQADSFDLIQSIEREFEIERALVRLPERCRLLIGLLYFEPAEPSYAEISRELGMPAASIGPTRARCLEKLRKFLT